MATSSKNRTRKPLCSSYVFKTKLWRYQGPIGWYFLTLPKGISSQIRKTHFLSEEGWGRLKTTCTIGKTKWRTAIWFDTKIGSYLLPIKADIRKKKCLKINDTTTCSLEFEENKWDTL